MVIPDAGKVALKTEQHLIYRGSALAFLLCASTFGAAYGVLPGFIQLPNDLESRLMFWAGSNLFVILWIMIGVRMVSRGRFHSAADIRGAAYSAPSPRIAVAAAFLQNTLEQSVLIMFSLLAAVLLLGSVAMPMVIASVLLFSIGRITFLIAYPKGAGARSFGMAATALPSLFAFVAAIAAAIQRLWS